MKLIVSIIIAALLAYVLGLFTSLPWWSFAISTFVVSLLITQSSGKSFLTGFLAIFILWTLLAWTKDLQNEHILSTKVAQIFSLGNAYWAILLITGIIGGLVGGFSALSASYLRKA